MYYTLASIHVCMNVHHENTHYPFNYKIFEIFDWGEYEGRLKVQSTAFSLNVWMEWTPTRMEFMFGTKKYCIEWNLSFNNT